MRARPTSARFSCRPSHFIHLTASPTAVADELIKDARKNPKQKKSAPSPSAGAPKPKPKEGGEKEGAGRKKGGKKGVKGGLTDAKPEGGNKGAKIAAVVGKGKAERSAGLNQSRGLSSGKATAGQVKQQVKKEIARGGAASVGKKSPSLKITFSPRDLATTTDSNTLKQVLGVLSKAVLPPKPSPLFSGRHVTRGK